MDSPTAKGTKKGLISKTWKRCKSFSSVTGRKCTCSLGNHQPLPMKSKSWPRSRGLITNYVQPPNHHQERKNAKKWSRVAPEGRLSVYVGSQKQRFVIKTEYVNHLLFKILLEEAESEYGYSSDGPLMLPCEVDHFINVLMEMDSDDDYKNQGCNFVARSHTSYHRLTPPRLIAMKSSVMPM